MFRSPVAAPKFAALILKQAQLRQFVALRLARHLRSRAPHRFVIAHRPVLPAIAGQPLALHFRRVLTSLLSDFEPRHIGVHFVDRKHGSRADINANQKIVYFIETVGQDLHLHILYR